MEERQRAEYIATQFKRAGRSAEYFREAVEMGYIADSRDRESCWSLLGRGELKHLIAMVWSRMHQDFL